MRKDKEDLQVMITAQSAIEIYVDSDTTCAESNWALTPGFCIGEPVKARMHNKCSSEANAIRKVTGN